MVLAKTGLPDLLTEWGKEEESWEGGLKTKDSVDYTVVYEMYVNRVHNVSAVVARNQNWELNICTGWK